MKLFWLALSQASRYKEKYFRTHSVSPSHVIYVPPISLLSLIRKRKYTFPYTVGLSFMFMLKLKPLYIPLFIIIFLLFLLLFIIIIGETPFF
jgi:hypothetical protein